MVQIVIIIILVCISIGLVIYNREIMHGLKVRDYNIYKKDINLRTLAWWIVAENSGHRLIEFIKDNNINSVAIYGYTELGRVLRRYLIDNGICVKYAIDQRAYELSADIDILKLDEDLTEVDAVIITSITDEKSTIERITNRMNTKVYVLREIIYSL